MRRLGYAIGGLALAGIAVAVILPNFLQFRMKSSGRPPGGPRTLRGGARPRSVFGGAARAPMSPVPPRQGAAHRGRGQGLHRQGTRYVPPRVPPEATDSRSLPRTR